jgi:hypothetical protein
MPEERRCGRESLAEREGKVWKQEMDELKARQ